MIMVENDTGNFEWPVTIDKPFSYEKRYHVNMFNLMQY